MLCSVFGLGHDRRLRDEFACADKVPSSLVSLSEYSFPEFWSSQGGLVTRRSFADLSFHFRWDMHNLPGLVCGRER